MSWEFWKEVIAVTANVIVIAGAVIVLFEWSRFRYRWRQKRICLENYLREKREKQIASGKKGEFSISHLVSRLGIPESEILNIAFGNKRIELRVTKDEKGFADLILLKYADKGG